MSRGYPEDKPTLIESGYLWLIYGTSMGYLWDIPAFPQPLICLNWHVAIVLAWLYEKSFQSGSKEFHGYPEIW